VTLTRRSFLSLATVPASIALGPAAWAAPEPISVDRFVPIGGIEQWVAIRGRDRARMAVLFLHGGFGEAQSPFLSLYAPWEKRYGRCTMGSARLGQDVRENGRFDARYDLGTADGRRR